MASLGLCSESGQSAPKKVAATPSSSGTTTMWIAPFGSTCAQSLMGVVVERPREDGTGNRDAASN